MLVDGVQWVGAEFIDVAGWDIAALSFHGYKWLMAGFGLGGLYVAPHVLDQIKPTFLGAHGLAEQMALPEGAHRLHPNAQRYALGGANVLGAIAMCESARLLNSVGIAEVGARNHALADALARGLAAKRGLTVLRSDQPTHQSCIAVFTSGSADGDERIVEQLKAARVYVARRAAGIRVSPHVFNTPNDVEQLLDAIG
jgi:selenocysteine lyase/cysteine desulfurase